MKYYKRIDKDGSTLTVESYSHDKPVKDAEEITREEFESFIAGLPAPDPAPMAVTLDSEVQELKLQFDSLEQRIEALELAK